MCRHSHEATSSARHTTFVGRLLRRQDNPLPAARQFQYVRASRTHISQWRPSTVEPWNRGPPYVCFLHICRHPTSQFRRHRRVNLPAANTAVSVNFYRYALPVVLISVEKNKSRGTTLPSYIHIHRCYHQPLKCLLACPWGTNDSYRGWRTTTHSERREITLRAEKTVKQQSR